MLKLNTLNCSLYFPQCVWKNSPVSVKYQKKMRTKENFFSASCCRCTYCYIIGQTGNKDAPIQLAQCQWLANSKANLCIHFFQIKYTEAILSNSTRKLLRFEIINMLVAKKVAHTRLPSVGFLSWSLFLAVSLQVTWVINLAVGCHYFPPGLQLLRQPLRGLLLVSLLGEQRHDGCEQFA